MERTTGIIMKRENSTQVIFRSIFLCKYWPEDGLRVGQNVAVYSKGIIVMSLDSFFDGSYGFVKDEISFKIPNLNNLKDYGNTFH